MSDPARDQLLGYLLGALDDAEQELVAERLENVGELRRDLAVLSRALAPLDAVRRDYSPPPDLAARTCRLVVSYPPRPLST